MLRPLKRRQLPMLRPLKRRLLQLLNKLLHHLNRQLSNSCHLSSQSPLQANPLNNNSSNNHLLKLNLKFRGHLLLNSSNSHR
jgi:ferric iron reductase protein FhuF